ncbi:MAG: hypothetical protein AAF518_23165 [Spirochaetota bacterium]
MGDLIQREDADFWQDLQTEMQEHSIEKGEANASLLSFRYSSKTISSSGGKTYIKATEKSYQNGQFSEKEFEGVVEGDSLLDSKLKDWKSFFLPFFR